MGTGSQGTTESVLLLERDSELAQLDGMIEALAAGRGQVVALEGPGGIGKTTLVARARARARQAGVRVLYAQASELEREFAFGVARQWLEPVLQTAGEGQRARLLSGAARHAAPALLDTGVSEESASRDESGAATERAMHGLYWLAVALAEEIPLLLVLDDAQWADEPSLRLLNFVAARLEGVPVSLLVACRPPEPNAPGMLLARLLSHPSAVAIRPQPLSMKGAATLIG